MKVKDYENLMNQRFIELEKESHIEDLYSVSVTENGWQWLQVFRGRLSHCKIIINAYKKIGYKDKKKFANQSTGEKQ